MCKSDGFPPLYPIKAMSTDPPRARTSPGALGHAPRGQRRGARSGARGRAAGEDGGEVVSDRGEGSWDLGISSLL